MSVKSKILAAAAALAIISGTAAVPALTADAATPSCGGSCVNVYSATFEGGASGPLTYHPHFVLDVYKRATTLGQPVILFRASNADPGEDFMLSEQGTVHDFYLAGLVSSSLNLHYKHNEAFELEYAPYGADSGLCAGTATIAANNVKVSLQPCGASSKTIWVDDTYGTSLLTGYVAAINGSDTNFSHPYMLTYPGSSFPTDSPRPQLFTSQRMQYSTLTVVDNQQFSGFFGVLP
jgi:hypothetical protein